MDFMDFCEVKYSTVKHICIGLLWRITPHSKDKLCTELDHQGDLMCFELLEFSYTYEHM